MKKLTYLIVTCVLLAAPVAGAETFCSSLVVEMTKDDGSAITGPDNSLTDATCGLTAEQAQAHHYQLKGLVGAVYVGLAKDAEAQAAVVATVAQ